MSKETLNLLSHPPPKNYKISSAFSCNFKSALTKAIGRNLNQLAILAHEGKVQFARLDEVYEKLSLVYLALCELAEQESR